MTSCRRYNAASYEDLNSCSLSATAKALARSCRTVELGALLHRHPWTLAPHALDVLSALPETLPARQLSSLLQQVLLGTGCGSSQRIATPTHECSLCMNIRWNSSVCRFQAQLRIMQEVAQMVSSQRGSCCARVFVVLSYLLEPVDKKVAPCR